MPTARFTREQRIRRRGEFQAVFDRGVRVHGRYLTLLMAPVEGAETRLGIVASKKLGAAVVRNRAKRLIREVFRLNPHPTGRAVDILVIPRRELLEAAFSSLEEDFSSACRRATTRLAGVEPPDHGKLTCRPNSLQPSPSPSHSACSTSTKRFFSPMFAGSCRFVPSCSEYAAEAIRRHGVCRGTLLAAGRLARCHPFAPARHRSGPGPRPALLNPWKSEFCWPSSSRSSCLYGYQAMFPPPDPRLKPPAAAPAADGSAPAQSAETVQPGTAGRGRGRQRRSRWCPTGRNGTSSSRTPKSQAVFTTRGGVLKHWRLKRYLGADGKPLDLVPSGVPDGLAQAVCAVGRRSGDRSSASPRRCSSRARTASMPRRPGELVFEYRRRRRV